MMEFWEGGTCGPFTLDPVVGGWPSFMDAADTRFEDWITCFGMRWDGCYIPQPLESLYQALEPGWNPGFLRDGSILAVLIVTCRDDCSIEDPLVFSEDLAVVPKGHADMCAYRQEYLHPIDRYTDRLLETRPPDKLAVAVLAGSDQEYQFCPPLLCGWPECTPEHPCLLPDDCGQDRPSIASPRLHGFARLLGTTSSGSPVAISGETCPSMEIGLQAFGDLILDRI